MVLVGFSRLFVLGISLAFVLSGGVLLAAEAQNCPYGYVQIQECLSIAPGDAYYSQPSGCYGGRQATTQDAQNQGVLGQFAQWMSDNIASCSSGFPAVNYNYPSYHDLACINEG